MEGAPEFSKARLKLRRNRGALSAFTDDLFLRVLECGVLHQSDIARLSCCSLDLHLTLRDAALVGFYSERFVKEHVSDHVFDLVPHKYIGAKQMPQAMKKVTVLATKHATLDTLNERLERELGIPAEFQQFAEMTWRKSKTLRVERCRAVENRRISSFDTRRFLVLDARTIMSYHDHDHPSPQQPLESQVLLFVKVYDAHSQTVQYRGTVKLPLDVEIFQFESTLRQVAGLPESGNLAYFEEEMFFPEPVIVRVDSEDTCREQLLEDGDILVVQIEPDGVVEYKYADEYMNYVDRERKRKLELKVAVQAFLEGVSERHTTREVVKEVESQLRLNRALHNKM